MTSNEHNTTSDDYTPLAIELNRQGFHVFPLDHPAHPECIGKHKTCDGQRGKHPAVTWGTWAVAPTEKMIKLEWGKRHGIANIGISCGPSNLVVLDEDQHGEVERWCVTYGFSLPDTYTVTTGRGRHLYFRWDHTSRRIGNSGKAMNGFKIDVRGDGGFAVAEGSQHSIGATYLGNGLPIAELPDEVTDLLLAETRSAPTQPEPGRQIDSNTKIPFGKRHHALVAYAGRLRKSGLDYGEVLPSFRRRWRCCEQPEGQIPEALFHDAACEYPCTWDEAEDKLRDVFERYPAGTGPSETDDGTPQFEDEPTTWEPVDLGPYLNGEIVQPTPTLGMARSDGIKLIYPGREHVVLGDTESGKTWYALGCAVAVLMGGGTVVYIHYEEPDATSTIERLLLLGVDKDTIKRQLVFIAPTRPVRKEWVEALVDLQPALVIHGGVNEAMTLQGNGIKDVEGASLFRRTLVLPFTRSGAATLACDHMPMIKDGSRVEAYGTVHKGNALDGARIQLDNTKPFGRQKRCVSWVFVTKDRPGYLRQHGKPTETPGKTFMGTLVVDDMTEGPNFLMKLYAPRDDDSDEAPQRALADQVHDAIYALPDHTVSSERILLACLREAGHKVRNTKVKDAIDDLIVSGRLAEVRGKRGAKGYRAILTASHGEGDDQSESDCVPSQ